MKRWALKNGQLAPDKDGPLVLWNDHVGGEAQMYAELKVRHDELTKLASALVQSLERGVVDTAVKARARQVRKELGDKE